MKKQILYVAMLAMLMVSCGGSSNEPSSLPKTALCWLVNSSDYYAIVYCGVDVLTALKPGENRMFFFGSSASYDIKITLHNVKDSEHYYVDPVASYSKMQKFVAGIEYKMTIRNEGIVLELK